MKQIMVLTLGLVACTASFTLAGPVQSPESQGPPYLASLFVSGPSRVTITTRSGDVLSVLEVPGSVRLSVHLRKGDFTPPNEKGDVTFSGDVSIRTRRATELVDGPALGQMMNAPLRLDVEDVVVVVLRDKQ